MYLEKESHWIKKALANIYFYNYCDLEKSFLKYCGDYHIFVYNHNGTAIIMDYLDHNVYIFMTDESEIAIVEFFRDIIIKDQENKGSIVLHVAAVEKDDRVIGVSGMNGLGKSTAMMELIFHAGYHFFTGDKLFVRVKNGQIIAKGWPDYPHLGVGTLSRYAVLVNHCKEFDIKNKQPKEKILLSPREFYDIDEFNLNSKVAILSAVIFLEFDLDNKSKKE